MGMRDEIRSHERTINKALESCSMDASEALASTTEAFRLLDGYRTRVGELESELANENFLNRLDARRGIPMTELERNEIEKLLG